MLGYSNEALTHRIYPVTIIKISTLDLVLYTSYIGG